MAAKFPFGVLVLLKFLWNYPSEVLLQDHTPRFYLNHLKNYSCYTLSVSLPRLDQFLFSVLIKIFPGKTPDGLLTFRIRPLYGKNKPGLIHAHFRSYLIQPHTMFIFKEKRYIFVFLCQIFPAIRL